MEEWFIRERLILFDIFKLAPYTWIHMHSTFSNLCSYQNTFHFFLSNVNEIFEVEKKFQRIIQN